MIPDTGGIRKFQYRNLTGKTGYETSFFAKNRPGMAFQALGDVTIVTAMSTLVGLELWVDQIGPQTKK